MSKRLDEIKTITEQYVWHEDITSNDVEWLIDRVEKLEEALKKQVEVSANDRFALGRLKFFPSMSLTAEQLRNNFLCQNEIIDQAIARQPRWNYAAEALEEE